ncbi:MAG: hypothetical protein Q9173_000234 [Seirophora scorigena]
MAYISYGNPGNLLPQSVSSPGVWGHTSSASEQSSAVPSSQSHETKGTKPAKKRSRQTAPGDDTSISDTGKPIETNHAKTSHQYSPGWVRDDQQCPEQWQSYQAQQEQDTEAVKRENQALKHMNNQLDQQIAIYKRQYALLLKLHGSALQNVADLESKSSVDHSHIAKLKEKLDSFGIFEPAGKSDHTAR